MFVFQEGLCYVALGGGGQEAISLVVRISEQLKTSSLYLDMNVKSDRMCVRNAVSDVCTG